MDFLVSSCEQHPMLSDGTVLRSSAVTIGTTLTATPTCSSQVQYCVIIKPTLHSLSEESRSVDWQLQLVYDLQCFILM